MSNEQGEEYNFFIMENQEVPYGDIIFQWAGIIPVIENKGIFVGRAMNNTGSLKEFGGHIESNENTYEAAIREYQEESGDAIMPVEIIDLQNSITVIVIPVPYFLTLPDTIQEYLHQFFIGTRRFRYVQSEILTRIHYFIRFPNYLENQLGLISQRFATFFNNNNHNEVSAIYYIRKHDFIMRFRNGILVNNIHYSVELRFLFGILVKTNNFPYIN